MPTEPQLASVTEFQDIESALKTMMPAPVSQSLVPKLAENFTVMVGYELTRPISDTDRDQAIALLQESLLPCGEEVAMKALYALKVRTANTPAERDIAEEKIALFLADIVDYPQDVVVAGCRAIANESRWFPAWADLRKELEWRVRPRRKKLEALRDKR